MLLLVTVSVVDLAKCVLRGDKQWQLVEPFCILVFFKVSPHLEADGSWEQS